MRLISLDLQGFRNYNSAHIEINSDITIIHGLNGHGKTSLLEAIYYTTLTQSFKTTSDRDCIKFNEDHKFFDIRAVYENRLEKRDSIRVFYERKTGKSIFLNDERLQTFKSHIGYVPVVLLKPDDLRLTFGSPSDRRAFLDVLLSQLSPVYLDSLMRYKKLLKQKNALLSSGQKVDLLQLDSWNDRLVEHGSVILNKRADLIAELSSSVEELYESLAQTNETAIVEYTTTLKGEGEIAEQFRRRLKELQSQEIAQQKSLIGPHRDDLSCLLGGKSVGKFGSQGENKSFLIALKLAEMQILGEKKEEKPILLFDDIFSELDAKRVKQLMEKIKSLGQVFITTTDEELIADLSVGKIHVENGTVN